MNSEKENIVFELIKDLQPVSFSDLISKKQKDNLDISSTDIQRAVWNLIDYNKVKFTSDRRLQVSESDLCVR